MFIGYYQNKIKFYTEQIINEPAIEKWEETQDEYDLDGDEYILNDDEYKERQKQKERERLNRLNVTRGDVFEALIRARGIEQPYIEQLIAVLPVPELDKKIYQSRLENALNFFREFPLFDILGMTLEPKITPQMWDNYFIKATNEETKANAWQELVAIEEVAE